VRVARHKSGSRTRSAGVPDEVAFATKTQIALEQLRRLLGQSAPRHWVLADVDYGVDTASVRHFATWDSFR
jgi:SRSO17 transposase